MRSHLEFLPTSTPCDRALRAQLEQLQAEATQLKVTLADLDAAIVGCRCEAGELVDGTLEAERKLVVVRAGNRALRASLNLNDWRPIVMLLFLVPCVLGSLVLAMTVLGSR